MKGSEFTRYAVGICAASLIVSGCGGSQGQFGAPATMQQSAATARYGVRVGSRMAPDAATTAFTVQGRSILLDGQPFFIKGVDYGNTQIDDNPDPNFLDDKNEPIWKPDLAAMCAAGVNAVKVYNVSLKSFEPYLPELGNGNKLKGYEDGKIDKFLSAAWTDCNHPIYVVLSINFGGLDVLNPAKLKALKAVYELSAKEYAAYPAFMGFSEGNEINGVGDNLLKTAAWWKGLNEIAASIRAGYKAANNAKKIITTTMIDDGLKTVLAGEANGFKIDVWGLNAYRSPTLGAPNDDIFKQIKSDTKRPAILSEYGSSAAYYPASTATHGGSEDKCGGYPPDSKEPPFYGLPPPKPWEGAKELPSAGNPSLSYLVDYVTGNQKAVYANSTINGGVDSGGFYFEWNDEWWKAGWSHAHIGGLEGNVIAEWAEGAGCYKDEAWFGLNSDKPVDREYQWPGDGNPFPKRPPDLRVPRPTLGALEKLWASE